MLPEGSSPGLRVADRGEHLGSLPSVREATGPIFIGPIAPSKPIRFMFAIR